MTVPIPTTSAGNGPPPDAPALLYLGEVMHARLKPVGHRFVYGVANLLVDLDRLDEANRTCTLFSVGRFNLYAFHASDHGRPDGGPLRGQIDAILAEAGVERPARVLLLCYPRVLGFVFNPLSVYFAYDAAGEIAALVYEVRNTFGESHTYVAPVAPGERSKAGIRQTRAKRFFVSPFMDMDQRYHFRVLPPGRGVRVRILEADDAGPTLAATFVGEEQALTSRRVLGLFAAMPLHTLKVVVGIHWEALRLWWKGAPYFSRGTPPPPYSFHDGVLSGPDTRR